MLFSLLAACVAFSFDGEFAIDTVVALAPVTNRQWTPSVAFDGTNYFAVWGDYSRNGVFGTRISPTGRIIDKVGIKIANTSAEWSDAGPRVAFGGGIYLVVWNDNDNFNLNGVRVNIAGVILDTTPFVISSSPLDYISPAVSFGNSNFLVVWTDIRSNENIYGARVTTTGITLDPSGIQITTNASVQEEPSVSFDGTNYLVVWKDERNGDPDIYGSRVTGTGTVLDGAGIPISTATGAQANPGLTFGNNNYFVVWDDNRDSLNLNVYGARVNPAGMVLDINGIAITNANNVQWLPKVTFDGTNYFTVWEDWRDEGDIYGARINSSGTLLDPSGIEICTTSVYEKTVPALVFGGTNNFIVWMDWRFDGDIYGSRVNNAGTVFDPAGLLISTQYNNQSAPTIASDGNNYLVVWEDNRAGYSDILGAVVSSTGGILTPTPIPIATAINNQENPVITYGGNNYFVVWQDYQAGNADIYGARISTAGVLLDLTGIPISIASGDQALPKVIFDGNNYFVVWEDERNGNLDIYGARVSTAGVVLDPGGIPISTASDNQFEPEIKFSGNNYFIVWSDWRSGASQDIYGARVNTSGTVLDPAGIPISTSLGSQGSYKIGFDGANYFVVWDDSRNGNPDIYGTRVSINGTVLDPTGIPISTAINSQYSPEIVYNGSIYFIAWQDERTINLESDIYGAGVDPSGVVLDPAGIPIAAANGNQTEVGIGLDGTDFLLVWKDNQTGDGDIRGAKMNAARMLTGFIISIMSGDQYSPVLTKGRANQFLIGWIYKMPSLNNTSRIWGKLMPLIIPNQGWTLMKPVPMTPSNKRVKGGGSLVVAGDSLIYCLKGNNTKDFYCYRTDSQNWQLKESVPYGSDRPKRVKSGGALVYDGDRLIYATKGNNTLEWLCYNILTDTWRHLKPVPSEKKIKGGNGLAKVKKNGVDCIFLLKGSKSRDNFIYYPDNDSWEKLPNAPVEFKKGSCVTGYNDSIVYVLKNKENFLYQFNIQSGIWTQKDTLPIKGRSGKSKRVKEGSALAADDSITIYTFKGGNTVEFWAYNILMDTWIELESMPRGPFNRRIKAGGSLVFVSGGSKGSDAGTLYATKGNNTDDFWQYNAIGTPLLDAALSEREIEDRHIFELKIIPNPNHGIFILDFGRVINAPIKVRVYNIAGELVWGNNIESRDGRLKIALKDLTQGIYILRFETDSLKTSQKLVIHK